MQNGNPPVAKHLVKYVDSLKATTVVMNFTYYAILRQDRLSSRARNACEQSLYIDQALWYDVRSMQFIVTPPEIQVRSRSHDSHVELMSCYVVFLNPPSSNPPILAIHTRLSDN
jgi:hypothetical protein